MQCDLKISLSLIVSLEGLNFTTFRAFKAMEVFPELPPIKRCHSYQVKSKYTYKCTGCGYR